MTKGGHVKEKAKKHLTDNVDKWKTKFPEQEDGGELVLDRDTIMQEIARAKSERDFYILLSKKLLMNRNFFEGITRKDADGLAKGWSQILLHWQYALDELHKRELEDEKA
jgi:hypothetical protein